MRFGYTLCSAQLHRKNSKGGKSGDRRGRAIGVAKRLAEPNHISRR